MARKREVGLKFDNEKPQWELLPLDTIEDIVKVMTYGAKKYAPNNWKLVEPKERYLAAALRHMTKWQAGEKIDPESGLPHLAHALCSLLFLHWKDNNAPKPRERRVLVSCVFEMARSKRFALVLKFRGLL